MLQGPQTSLDVDRQAFLDDLSQALYAAKLVSYAQGFMLMQAAGREYHWSLNLGEIAMIWRNGCIIRSAFLEDITKAYDRDPNLPNLLLDEYFRDQVENAQAAWRRVVSHAVTVGLPVPAMGSAVSFYDGYRNKRLPANMIQAQRDYFGAHTYERVDRPRGEFFHTDWTGEGGNITASSYNA